MLVSWVAATLLLASPDAGPDVPDVRRSAEHRALETQVELLRKEAARPRDWHQRERGERLKQELQTLERVLSDVESLYAIRLARCQKRYPMARDPRSALAHPGYFGCPDDAMVSDDVVRQIRRRHEVERRLKEKGLPVQARTALQKELAQLVATLEKQSGEDPLYVDDMDRVRVEDAGVPDEEPGAPPFTSTP
ncbi:MAG: hypothetical protein AB2A00_28725 [Myxococcota bacterium]